MKRILKTTIASALVLSMALSGATAAVGSGTSRGRKLHLGFCCCRLGRERQNQAVQQERLCQVRPGCYGREGRKLAHRLHCYFCLQGAEELHLKSWSDHQYGRESADQGGTVQRLLYAV